LLIIFCTPVGRQLEKINWLLTVKLYDEQDIAVLYVLQSVSFACRIIVLFSSTNKLNPHKRVQDRKKDKYCLGLGSQILWDEVWTERS
jgi:hypothetical protein